MRPRTGLASGKGKRSVIVLAGEDSNDRKVIRELITDLCPGLDCKLVEIRDPVRLKSATGGNLQERAGTLARKAKAFAVREGATLAGLVVHEDLDGVTGPRYTAVRQRVSEALAKRSPCPAVLALAAWETEAWPLLFPEAFPAVHAAWAVPASVLGKDTGRLNSPKEVLCRKLGGRTYRESDSVEIMRAARRLGLIGKPLAASNRSYSDFCTEARRLGPGR